MDIRYPILLKGHTPSKEIALDNSFTVFCGSTLNCFIPEADISYDALTLARWAEVQLLPANALTTRILDAGHLNKVHARTKDATRKIFVTDQERMPVAEMNGFVVCNLRTYLQNMSRRLDVGYFINHRTRSLQIERDYHSSVRKELEGVKYSFEGDIRRRVKLD